MDNIISNLRVTGSGRASNSLTQTQQSFAVGSNPWPSMDIDYSYGDGDNEVNLWFQAKDNHTGANQVDLRIGQEHVYDLGDLHDFEGNAIAFTHVKRVLLSVVDATGKKSLRFGPLGEPGGAQLWFVASTGDADALLAGEEVFTFLLKDRPVEGWEVSAASETGGGSKIVVSNPVGVGTGDDDLKYTLLILGVGTTVDDDADDDVIEG